MVQMGRDRVNSSPEVVIVGEVDGVALAVALGDREAQEPLTTERIVLVVVLVVLQELQLLTEGCGLDHLGGDVFLVEAFGDVGDATANGPGVLHDFQYFFVELPANGAEYVEDRA